MTIGNAWTTETNTAALGLLPGLLGVLLGLQRPLLGLLRILLGLLGLLRGLLRRYDYWECLDY